MQPAFLLSPPGFGLIIALAILISLSVFRMYDKAISGWNSAAMLLSLYALVNVAIGFFVPVFWEYILLSAGTFVLLYFFVFIVAPLITGKSYSEYGDNAMLLTVPVYIFIILWMILSVIKFMDYLL